MASHSHAEGDKHDHTAGANARQLAIAMALTGTFVAVEVAGGLYFNSLALLSDAADMFTDAAALALALTAIHIGKKTADDKRTFGYRRFEILAAAINTSLLFVVAGYVLYEGIKRILEPEEETKRRSEQLRQNFLSASPQLARRYVKALVARVDVRAGEIVVRGFNGTV